MISRKARTLFASEDDALDYMASVGLEAPRGALLEQLGRHSEAAESQLSGGNIAEAVRLFLLDGSAPGALARAAEIILDGLWSKWAFAEQPAPLSSETSDSAWSSTNLLQIVDVLGDHHLGERARNEVGFIRDPTVRLS